MSTNLTSSLNCSISNNSTLALCNNRPTISAPSSVLASLLALLSLVYYPMTAYYLPFTLLFGALNNVLILVVMLLGRNFREQRSSTNTAYLYYIAFAAADIGCVFAIPLLRIVGPTVALICTLMALIMRYKYLNSLYTVFSLCLRRWAVHDH